MRLVALTQADYRLAIHVFRTMLKRGEVGEPTAALLAKIERAVVTRTPPSLEPSPDHPRVRGPRRAVAAVLWSEGERDVLLLRCGHLVTRRQRQCQRFAYCEGCAVCREPAEPAEPAESRGAEKKLGGARG